MNSTLPPRLRLLAGSVSRTRHARPFATRAPGSGQAFPRAGFYDALMEYKLPEQDHSGTRRIPPSQAPPEPAKPTPPPAAPKPPPPKQEAPPKQEETPAKPTKARRRKKKNNDKDKPTAEASAAEPEQTAEDRARIVFGSSLAGPARREDLRSRGTLVNGVLVPPKPDEPDHCCMSGCVNCVWDQYREDMEEWMTASAEADRLGIARRGDEEEAPLSMTMDDDGGGSETNWTVQPQKISRDFWDEELYKGVPVGIREFMKQEKRLKERHAQEGTLGG